jgi:hypothetical protein
MWGSLNMETGVRRAKRFNANAGCWRRAWGEGGGEGVHDESAVKVGVGGEGRLQSGGNIGHLTAGQLQQQQQQQQQQ